MMEAIDPHSFSSIPLYERAALRVEVEGDGTVVLWVVHDGGRRRWWCLRGCGGRTRSGSSAASSAASVPASLTKRSKNNCWRSRRSAVAGRDNGGECPLLKPASAASRDAVTYSDRGPC